MLVCLWPRLPACDSKSLFCCRRRITLQSLGPQFSCTQTSSGGIRASIGGFLGRATHQGSAVTGAIGSTRVLASPRLKTVATPTRRLSHCTGEIQDGESTDMFVARWFEAGARVCVCADNNMVLWCLQVLVLFHNKHIMFLCETNVRDLAHRLSCQCPVGAHMSRPRSGTRRASDLAAHHLE